MMTGQIKMTLLILNTAYAHRHRNSAVADADEFIKLVARGLNRYNIIKRETCIQLKNITIRLTEKEHN